jgi:hypothetical protein
MAVAQEAEGVAAVVAVVEAVVEAAGAEAEARDPVSHSYTAKAFQTGP